MRAVAGCAKPIVSAVGHETDVTLCDLAADLRAPTPSAAAECVVPLRCEMDSGLREIRAALESAALWQIERKSVKLDILGAKLSACRPEKRLEAEELRLCAKREALSRAAKKRLSDTEAALLQKQRELELLSPYRVLARGYAIVNVDGRAIGSVSRLTAGDLATIRFADGCVRARIEDMTEG